MLNLFNYVDYVDFCVLRPNIPAFYPFLLFRSSIIDFRKFILALVSGLFGDLYFMDLFELQWTKLGLVHGSPPSPRKFAGIAGGAEWGGKIYVFGGMVGVTGYKRAETKDKNIPIHGFVSWQFMDCNDSKICF
jgi:hypothetical protein